MAQNTQMGRNKVISMGLIALAESFRYTTYFAEEVVLSTYRWSKGSRAQVKQQNYLLEMTSFLPFCVLYTTRY